MDMDMVVIFAFLLIAASMVFAMVHKIHQRTVEHEERKLELKARIAEAEAQKGAARSENQMDIEDRLRVLERIVTDPSADLSRQIEDLRSDTKARDVAARETAQ